MQSHSNQSDIAIIGNHWFPDKPGGLDRYVYELVHSLAASECRINLFGIGLPSYTSVSSVQLTNLAHSESSLWQRLWSTHHTLHHFHAIPVDAINIHFALYGLAALPHLPKHVPVTFTFHGPWALESQQEGESKLSIFLKQQMENLVYNRCDRFIVLSKAFGEILHREYHISWDKIHVIPGGVDIHRFQSNLTRQQARQQLGWPTDRFILFTPRRLVQRMGLDKLLTALAQLTPYASDVWLAIAGKGPLKETLERQAIDLQLTERVRFLGFLPDEQLPIAYQAADLTLMPSQSLEGFGLVLLESLACGTPVLCTPVGGMPEVITDFSPQLITDSPSAESIANKLQTVIAREISLPARDACRTYASTHFNWTYIAQQVQQVVLA